MIYKTVLVLFLSIVKSEYNVLFYNPRRHTKTLAGVNFKENKHLQINVIHKKDELLVKSVESYRSIQNSP